MPAAVPRSTTSLITLVVAALLLFAGCGGDGKDGGRGERQAGKKSPPMPRDRGDVDVHLLHSTLRLGRRTDLGGAPASAQLDVARGEREGVQLAVVPARRGTHVITGLKVTGGLASAGRGITVRTYVQRSLRVERGSPAGRSGTYYDPLVESRAALEDSPRVLEAGDRLYAWIDVEVAPGAKPGTVSGSVDVLDRAGVAATARLTVVVRQPTIPDRPTMESSVGVDANQLVRFEGVADGSPELQQMLGRYFSELAAARLSTADPNVLLPGTLANVPVTAADERFLVETMTRRGAGTFRIPMYTTYPFADPLGVDRAAAVDHLRRVARELRRRGWLERSYVYLIDEPDDSEAGDVRELAALVHAADPQLRVLLTAEPQPIFDTGVDIWVPNVSKRFDPAAVRREQARGRDVWWYPSISTYRPYATLFIDEDRPTPRALGWLAWRYGVTGFLYWTATHWHEIDDPYRDSATFRETSAVGNGDGVLLYPGRPMGVEGPVPSVRLFQLRDGMEDVDLLTAASCVGTAAERRQLVAAVTAAAPSMTSIPIDPDAASRIRDTVFAVLDRAAAAGRYDPSSRTAPACGSRG